MPTALGIASGMPFRPIASVGGGPPPATQNVVEFRSKIGVPPATGDNSMYLLPVPPIVNDLYNRFYVSFWVNLPGTGANYRGAGFCYGDYDTDPTEVPLNKPSIGVRCCLNGSTWNCYVDILVLNNPPVVGRFYASRLITFAASANSRWKHILIEYDSTETVLANRCKIYLNDTKQTQTDQAGDVDSGAKLNQVLTSPIYDSFMNLSVGEFLSGSLAYSVNQISDYTDEINEPFVTVNGVSQVAGLWIKLASSNLFDFDIAADRRNFISSSLGYVTHQSVMGGQTADAWAPAGHKNTWTGYTERTSVFNATTPTPITAS